MWLRSIIAVLLAIMLSMAWGAPSLTDDLSGEQLPQLRVTCDVLSFSLGGFNPGDSACALNCLRQGFKGGSCSSKKVCVCRK